jgi:hypothetical protein
LYLNKNAIGGFADQPYWSSSEVNPNLGYGLAWYQNFYAGYQGYDLKNYALYVRAIRAF